ncbi:transcriptional activator xlnR [Purpureocillium lavendulum]|uniref:Transcriptional activator xlnR n=1 Tax=Purpureocillium lavendulum TaxID=1247861 RepID=A0AB34FCW7_9HYPO|nr:transcriptional activator xlnR [Purpureocillium lavendulum]
MDDHFVDSEVLIPDESGGYPSPARGPGQYEFGRSRCHRGTTATGSDAILPNMFQKAATDNCCYKFLEPVLPYVCDIVPASVACELLGIFMTDPGSSLFCGASPYILTRIFRKKTGGLRAENEIPHPNIPALGACPPTTTANEPAGVIDDVLTFILLSIAVSGSDFKSDCFKWWSKAIRLAHSLSLNREDERCPGPVSPCANPICSCRRDREDASIADIERKEERRRVFWLLYSLDRHLSLSFNTVLSIPDSYCEVYAPLPESIWENLDQMGPEELPYRVTGPPLVASGTGFFEYFLPLMAILGDIIEVHHRRRHPRLGGQEDTFSVAVIQDLLSNFELTLGILGSDASLNSQAFDRPGLPSRDVTASIPTPTIHHGTTPSPSIGAGDQPRVRLVKAYSTHILHVLHVLLHGKWDAISMLDDGDNWIASQSFTECASHAISASQSVSTILLIDPELTFMSYLFGIYLLQGSFILLLFADRMPQIGPNESVEHACEDIIRAHEVCVVTLNTEFQV